MTVHDCFSIAYLWWQSLLFLHLLHCRTLKPLALWGIHKLWHHSTSSLDSPHGWVLMTGARSTDRNESPCLLVLNAASCSLKLACEPALVSAFWIYIYTGKCLKPSVYLMATSIFQIYEITACSSLLLTWCMSLYVCVYVTDTENNVHVRSNYGHCKV